MPSRARRIHGALATGCKMLNLMTYPYLHLLRHWMPVRAG